MLSDIQIAQQAVLKPITKIAQELGIEEEELEPYGRYKAKVNDKLFQRVKDRKDGRLVLVTAINPTPAGEGKPPSPPVWDRLWRKSERKRLSL